MNLDCLIRLLVEKEYIKVDARWAEGTETIVVMYECRIGFDEIFQKVKGSEYSSNIVIYKARDKQSKFLIIDMKNLENALIRLGDGREKFGFKANARYPLGQLKWGTLFSIIQDRTRFKVLDFSVDGENFFNLEDLYLKECRTKEEEDKKNEIIDFLGQLP